MDAQPPPTPPDMGAASPAATNSFKHQLHQQRQRQTPATSGILQRPTEAIFPTPQQLSQPAAGPSALTTTAGVPASRVPGLHEQQLQQPSSQEQLPPIKRKRGRPPGTGRRQREAAAAAVAAAAAAAEKAHEAAAAAGAAAGGTPDVSSHAVPATGDRYYARSAPLPLALTPRTGEAASGIAPDTGTPRRQRKQRSPVRSPGP